MWKLRSCSFHSALKKYRRYFTTELPYCVILLQCSFKSKMQHILPTRCVDIVLRKFFSLQKNKKKNTYRKKNISFTLYLDAHIKFVSSILILIFLLSQLKKNPVIELVKSLFGLSQHTVQTTFFVTMFETRFPFSESDVLHYTKQGKAIRQKLLVSVPRV